MFHQPLPKPSAPGHNARPCRVLNKGSGKGGKSPIQLLTITKRTV